MTDRVKIGLIGAGVFAGYHANKLSAHPRIEFSGVVDRNPVHAKSLASRHNVEAVSLRALLRRSDAVVIATPASTHERMAIKALEAGCHCLIEKPLATSYAEIDAITALAASKKLTVQVGHQERMVLRAIGLDAVEARPLKIEAVRNSTYSERGTDTSVTLDLMTHDIDLCFALIQQMPESIGGEAQCVRSDTPDMSYARLTFRGSRAFLEASRVAEKSERRMKITYRSGTVDIDFNAKTLTHSTPFSLNTDFAGDLRAQDSLGAATDVFVQAILNKVPVLVSAVEGAMAAKAAIQIDDASKGER